MQSGASSDRAGEFDQVGLSTELQEAGTRPGRVKEAEGSCPNDHRMHGNGGEWADGRMVVARRRPAYIDTYSHATTAVGS